MMRKRLGVLSALALAVALVVPVPASADAHDQITVQADEFSTRIDLALSTAVPSWTSVEGWVAADSLGPAPVDSEIAFFFRHPTDGPTPLQVDAFGSAAPDRWVGGELTESGPQFTFLFTAGNDPLLCGDVVAQLYMEVFDGETLVATLDLRDIPTQPCPVIADLETVLDDGAYLFDSSGARFQFTGEQVTFRPGVTNEGPDEETDVGFDFRIDYYGVADDPQTGVDFTWSLDTGCLEFGVNTVAPTAICRGLGSLAAGNTITKQVVVDWMLPGDYLAVTLPWRTARSTVDPDGFNQTLHRFQVLAPDGDFDGDGINNGIDRSGSTWAPLTPSSAFDDTYSGGGTYGTVETGDVTVTDNAPGGVTVDATTAATLTACGFPVSLAAATSASIECGSISITVNSGVVEVTLTDGSTLTLDEAGDEVTAEATQVTVVSGSATVTPSGGGAAVEVGQGETLPVTGTDTDDDGVDDTFDLCPGTAADETGDFDLKKNRYAWDGSAFVDADGESPGFTIADTGGCSASQIIEQLGLGKGHERFGITKSALMDWIDSIES